MRSSKSGSISLFLSTCIGIFSFFTTHYSYAASALAAWSIRKDGVLQLRTSKQTRLNVFFQYADNENGDRVWVDFPGELSNPRKITGNGPIKEVRLGKPFQGYTRLVIEFKSNVGLNPSKLKLVGVSPNKWELKFVGMPVKGFEYIGEGSVDRNIIRNSKYKYSSPPTFKPLNLASLKNVKRGRYLVVIDPGHGGPDPGAVGPKGLKESDVVLDVSRQVSSILSVKGVKVLMTRKYQTDLDLQPRVTLANKANADAFISIHANATRGYRSDVNGIETYYYSGYQGLRLAKSLQEEVLKVSRNSPDRGVRRGRFYVIRKTNMPAALVEIGFLTGSLDSKMLMQADHRKNLAFAISKGILNYLEESY